jgi:hypothetical protein
MNVAHSGRSVKSVIPRSCVGGMEVGTGPRGRIDSCDSLSQWERSDLGKDMRRLGLSYGEIMDLIPIRKSTMATWCRGVKVSSIGR